MLNLLQLNHYKTDNINQYCLSVLGVSIFKLIQFKGKSWFRLFGCVIRIKSNPNSNKKNGYDKSVKIGNYKISLLK